MPTTINRIDITSVSATRIDKAKYKVTLTWMLNGDSALSCPGDYEICLEDIDGESKTQTKTAEKADDYAAITFEEINEDDDYYVTVRAPKDMGGVESDSWRFITDQYENFSGSYDGKTLSLAWENKIKVPEGNCVITGDNKYSRIYTIYPGSERAEIDNVCFRLKRIFTVKAYSVSGSSLGPMSEELTFYTAPPFLTDVDIVDGDKGKVINAEFTSDHDNIEKASLVFCINGEKVYETAPVSVSKKENAYFLSADLDTSMIPRNEIYKCTVSCAYIKGNAKTLLRGPGSEMPLVRPAIKAEDIQNGKAVMRICYPKDVAVYGFELADTSIIYGDIYTVNPRSEAAAVRPRFDRNGIKRSGVSSDPVSGFIRGYYLTSDNSIVYRNTSFSETSAIHIWNEELFDTPLTEAIVSGALNLKYEDGKYILTIDTPKALTMEEYNGFIGKIKDNVTPGGFFALNDAILRISPHMLKDTSYLLCAYTPSERLSDIRPEMKLTVNTAVYMPQYDHSPDSAKGFVYANNAAWSFIFDSDSGSLEPDLFIGKIARHMVQDPLEAAARVTYASGVADFMFPSFRQPYFRILFPQSLRSSVGTEDPFPSDNTVIMASGSYGDILDACQMISTNPASINQLNVPLMIFRGRSILSLSIPVHINGNICYVPVGCDVGKALSIHGYGCGASVKMMRENDDRIPCPVFTEENAELGGIILVPGDRLEV